MPRFLGRDYYNDDFIARRDLSARASLTVPQRFEEDCENDQSVSSEIYRVYQKSLGDLSPFEDFDDISKSGLDVSDKTVSGVEQLQWVLKWKEFGDGNYIEIVPSSNPESESSLFDSQPDSLTEACEVEDFSHIPLQWTLEDKGYLEEPVHVVQSELLTTCLPNLMKWLTQALGPPLEDLSSAAEEDGQQVSEDALFGKTDLHLEVSADLGSEVPPEPSSSKTFREQETFEPHIFPQAKAEELMYPVMHDDAACSSRQHNHDPQTLVHEARATCIQQENLQASPPLLPKEHLENDADEWSLKELVKSQQCKVEGPEKLLVSPVSDQSRSHFLLLNEQEEMVKPKPDTSVLESPVILLTSSSPSLFDDNMKEALLEPWSQDTLADNSPLLNAEEVSKLEEKLRYAETCFGNIQAVKFLEPQLYNHEEEAKKKNLGLLSEALHLAASVNCTAGLAQLELNLAWDLTHPARHQLSQFCPEPFSLGPASHAQTNTWKMSLEFETVETMVERELEKKAIQDALKETAEDKAVNQLGNPKDGLSLQGKKSAHNDHLDFNCKDVPETKDLSVGISAAASKFVSKLPDTNSSNSPLQSITNTTGSKPKNESHVVTQVPVGKYVMYKKQDMAQKTIATSSSKPSDFTPRNMIERNKVEILETPVLAAKHYDVKGSTKNPSSSQDVASNGRVKDMTYHDHQLVKTVPVGPSQEAAGGETTALTGFDLRFDEEDLDLGSDSFDDITSPDKTSKLEATSSAALCQGVAFDPVDNFLMMRDARTSGSKTQDLVKGHSIVRPVERTQQAVGKPHHPGVITPMTVLPKKAGAKQQIFLTVSLSGPYLSALQEMCSQAEPHMDSLRTLGIVSANATFLGLRPDYTRFLLKDRMTRLENTAATGDASSQVQGSTDEGYRSVAMVHTLRLAAHMLVHCCLESAIVHLGAMQDKHTVLTGALEGLRKALFQCQFGAQQSGQLHPKVAAVCREIQQHRQSSPSPHKVLVVVRHEQSTLVKTLQAAISQDGTTAHILTGQDGQHSWPSGCECVLTCDQGAAVALLQVCSLVLEFESDPQSPMHNACQTENVQYVGLSVQETQTMTETKMPSADKGVTVIGSQHLIQFQQLLQLLETRHNILVVRRDYASLGHEHYPDVVANVHKGAVLVPAGQLREEGGLERVTERLASVGLQLSAVWVLLHGMGDSCSRDLFDKDAMKKMVQLQALMANLSTSAKGFLAHYKVLLCKTSADVALYISHLTTLSSTPRSESDNTLTAENCPLPPVEMSKEEHFLLGIPCLNPFRHEHNRNKASCQLLLSRACVGQILTMTLDQLRSLLPELPESCLLNLHRVVNMDRGLQLRPYVTDTHSSSQTYDHNNSPSRHHPLPDSTSLLDGQHEEKVDRAVPDDSQTPLPVIDRSQRQTGPPSSCYQDSERSDYVSPQTTLPSVPLSLSRSLHYTDQPTPLLPPAQKVSEESDGFHAKNMYRSGSSSYTERDSFDPRFSSHMYRRQELDKSCQLPVLEFGSNQQNFHPTQAKYFQEESRPRTSDIGHGSQEYALLDYHGTRNSLGYSASSVPEFSGDQRQEPPSRVLQSGLGEVRAQTLSHSQLRSYHPLGQDVPSGADIISSSRLNTSHLTSPLSVNSVKPAHISAGRSHQSRFPDQRRMLDVHSLEQPVGHLADPLHSSSLLTPDHQFLSPPLKYLKTNTVHDPDHSSIDFASNRPFEGRRSHAEDHSSIDFASNRPFEGRRSHAEDHSSIDFASNRPFEGRRSYAEDHSSIDFASNRPFEGRRSHAEDQSSIDFASNRPFEGRRSHAEDQSSIDFASNRPFEGRRSHAGGITPAVSGSGPVDYYRTNSTWNDHNLWPSVHSAQGRFMNDREVYQKKAEPNQNQAFLQRNETLPLENPVSPSWQTGFTKTWESHNYSLDPGYRKTSSQIFPSAEESDAVIHPVESLRPQTTLAKELVCVRDMDPSESGNMARTYPAHFRQLTRPDFPSPSGGDGYHSPGRESSATRYGDEDTRHPPPDVTAPRSQPSFCEDLAATTRRLLQGRSPGLLLSGGHHFHKPRTPVHRISVGLAQPLRREEASMQDSGKTVIKREQVEYQPASPTKPFTGQPTLPSPPLDMDWESTVPGGSHHISDNKLKKWSAHLQYKKKLACDAQSRAFSEGGELYPSAEKTGGRVKGQKLTYQSVPGTGGQTRLAFL